MSTPYVGFFRRALAFVVDNLLIILPPLIICGPFFAWQMNAVAQLPESEIKAASMAGAILLGSLLWQFLILLTYWLYFAFCESSPWQATLGKKLLRIKVVDQQGKRLHFWHATGRTFARLLSQLTFYIGFVMAGCTRRKQALHDKIAQTYVVYRNFQPGDKLPDSKGHPVWMGIWCALLGFLFIVGLFSVLEENLAKAQAEQAVNRLEELVNSQVSLPQPLKEEAAVYYQRADGYRAVLQDGQNTTLFLSSEKSEVCCEQQSGSNCYNLNLSLCSK
ncbi:MAG: RDD family protein [Elusimicrobiaceae bacterium]|nr:RDD family protein [Elusimicrobiaceae bacterium]